MVSHPHHSGEGKVKHPPDTHTLNFRDALARDKGTRRLLIALTITSVFMVVEFLGGLWTNSLALLADAGHMLTDAGALGLGLFAAWFSHRPATPEKTYGYYRVEILAALINGAALFIIAFFILHDAYWRFLDPEAVKSVEMLMIASLGLAANLVCGFILYGSYEQSLNVKGAFLHVLGDILGSLAAVTAALAMIFWQAFWADPLMSVLVSLLILFSAWRLVKDSVFVLLEGTPSHINVALMRQELCKVPGVESVHDLHVWTLTSGLHAMTCHAVVAGSGSRSEILERLSNIPREQFNVDHTTIQIEEEDICKEKSKFCDQQLWPFGLRWREPVCDVAPPRR